MNDPSNDYVTWFRNSSPYINAHRGRTFVVMISGEAIEDARFHHIIHDLALLSSLGIRLVVVHGARPQISSRLEARGIRSRFEHHTRVTDAATLEAALDAVGSIRLKLEGLFSMGLANSPMFNAGIQLVCGNFVIAKPVGVRNGFDYQHTGEVRRIQVDAITRQLDGGSVVLLSPIGCSPTGELFNLNSEEVASTAAIALKADKIIFMGDGPGVTAADGSLLREMSPQDAGQLLAQQTLHNEDIERQLTAACHAASNGVARAHLVNFREEGALLKELFTRDGCGTLVTKELYENIRGAWIEDVGGILELIEPMEQEGMLVRRSRELLESEIKQFTIIERDGMVIGCAALYPLAGNAGELACVAVHPDYRNSQRGRKLLERIERRARQQGIVELFVLTTHTAHWFQEQGFEQASPDDLPGERRALYNWQRNSKVFRKKL